MKRLFSNALKSDGITISNTYSPEQFMLTGIGFGLSRAKLPELKSMIVKKIANPSDDSEVVFVDGGKKGISIGKFVVVNSERFNKYTEISDPTPVLEWLGVTESITLEDAENAIKSFGESMRRR